MRQLFLLLLPAGLFCSCGPTPPVPPVVNANCFCADTAHGDSLCSEIPHEVALFNFVGYQSALTPTKQPPFDVFSWQSFVALNWPADANGHAKNAPIGSDNSSLRVWEYYPLADTVFIPNNPQKRQRLVLKLKPMNTAAKKRLYQFSKFSDDITINNHFIEADGNSLIDKNLNYVLFEERMNNDEWNYINTKNLRTEAGQQTFVTTSHINLPAGFYAAGQWGKPDSGPVGMIEIKASWRILDPAKGDDTTKYYHQSALILVDSSDTWSHHPLQFTAMVGLVGMHIVHKTGKFSKMIWSTFEHVDNVPDNPQEAQNAQRNYSFYHPQCLNLPVNQPPYDVQGKKGMWNDQAPYADSYALKVKGEGGDGRFGTQVMRTYPIYFTTDSINRLFQTKLAGTVWANYRLIGTQWFIQGDAPPGDTVPNAPVYLANATMETYIQSDASCISCHAFATIAGTPEDSSALPKYSADFSFLFNHAAETGTARKPASPTVPKKK